MTEREQIARIIAEALRDFITDFRDGAERRVSTKTADLILARPAIRLSPPVEGRNQGSNSDSASGNREQVDEGTLPSPSMEPDGFRLLRAEFAKPQFMTTTASTDEHGAGRYSVEFSFVGDQGRERMHDLHDAFIAAGRAINGRGQ